MKNSIQVFVITVFFVLPCISAKKETSQIAFKSIKIGNQIWMIENLSVATFRNGDLIPEAEKVEDWQNATKEQKPAWCYYNGNKAYGKKYGKLYNWYAVNDKRGLAPQGWHIATDSEYITLIIYLGGSRSYNEIASQMKSKSGWKNNSQSINSCGFSALPAGARDGDGEFGNLGSNAYFWTSTEDANHSAAYFYTLSDGDATVWKVINFKSRGYSVRCIKD